MKITAIECFVLLVPDYRADACTSAQDDLVVKIHTDDGLVGIGETDTNPWVAKAMIEAPGTHIMGLGLKEMLLGQDPRDVEGLWEKMYTGSAMTGRRGLGICAIGALDMALWDLRGKIEGKPCWQLLGGAAHTGVTPLCLAAAGRRRPRHLYARASWSARSRPRRSAFEAVKLEVCIKGPYSHNSLQIDDDREIARIVAACREAIGPGVTVMVDVAYCWRDWKEALRAIEMFADEDIYFVETPLPSDDIDGYAKLAAASPCPDRRRRVAEHPVRVPGVHQPGCARCRSARRRPGRGPDRSAAGRDACARPRPRSSCRTAGNRPSASPPRSIWRR